ncbi:hypothetical protein QYE76_042172 [Lolium multiflorum]|uniref:Aminotransferase-like plant mobile domain-containing protein n=1 Tax=Lolium multiflorum TaxID=4521 RepID=A0AAD8TER0_LOLMU|nr:hypothetical protein QYE76_042172 [Lolium multiflorum]
MNAAALTAFVDRWRPETHTFHLRAGEMTPTLQDVSMIFGLPIQGEPLCMNTASDGRRRQMEDLIGMAPPPPAHTKERAPAGAPFAVWFGGPNQRALRERRRVPTANGQMSGPSAQRPSSTGDGVDRRHRPAVGTPLVTQTVTIGENLAVGTGWWRPTVTVGTRTDRRAQPLGCHGAVYVVPTVAHGTTTAVGTATDCWVPSPAVPTATHGTTTAVSTANDAPFYVYIFLLQR